MPGRMGEDVLTALTNEGGLRAHDRSDPRDHPAPLSVLAH